MMVNRIVETDRHTGGQAGHSLNFGFMMLFNLVVNAVQTVSVRASANKHRISNIRVAPTSAVFPV